LAAARSAFESLVERAQERFDRETETIARAGLARCHLRRREYDAARGELGQAEARLESPSGEAAARVWAVRARLSIADGEPGTAVRRYLAWAEAAGQWASAIDACELLAGAVVDGVGRDGRGPPPDERVHWLQHALEVVDEHGPTEAQGRLLGELATALEALDQFEEAFEAWEGALRAHSRHGGTRQVVSAAWAAGTLAVRLGEWPSAQQRLEQAITAATAADDCGDLLALALAELARVQESYGDVVEARRTLLRALVLSREHDLADLWPARWTEMQEQARKLELNP
jgi:tetratricopeptide (TPR) repeat protein